MFLKDLSEGKRIVDIYDYYEKDQHSLLVLEYLEVRMWTIWLFDFSLEIAGRRVVL